MKKRLHELCSQLLPFQIELLGKREPAQRHGGNSQALKQSWSDADFADAPLLQESLTVT